MTKLENEVRTLRKNLKSLVAQVEIHINEIDRIMKMPATVDRGKLIAKSTNNLELQKDLAKRFGLGAFK